MIRILLILLCLAVPAHARHGRPSYPDIPSTDITQSDYAGSGASGHPIAFGTNDLAGAIDFTAMRMDCIHDHFAWDDPVVAPGKPGGNAHLHDFFGNWNTDAFSTYHSLRASGNGSSCPGGPLNRTGYWTPALIDPVLNRAVTYDGATVYYKYLQSAGYSLFNGSAGAGMAPPAPTHGFPASSLSDFYAVGQQMPNGIRFIFGYDVHNRVKRSPMFWQCTDFTTGTSEEPDLMSLWNKLVLTGFSTTVGVCPTIYMRLDAPTCWDGKHLDITDHFSHLAFLANDGGTVYCPSTHPVLVPFLSTILFFSRGTENFGNWYLGSDRQDPNPANWTANGESFHTDWFGAWDPFIFDYFQTHSLQVGYGNQVSPNTATGTIDAQSNSTGVLKDGGLGLTYGGGPRSRGGGGQFLSLPSFGFGAVNGSTYPNNTFQMPPRRGLSPLGGCPAASNFISRSYLTGTDATNMSNLICGLVEDGLINDDLQRQLSCGSKFDFIYIFAVPDQRTARLNLCGQMYGIVEHGSPTWTANQGYTGVDGSTTVYLSTQEYRPRANYPLSTIPVNAGRDNQHISIWSNTSGQQNGIVTGELNNADEQTYIVTRSTTNQTTMRLDEFSPTGASYANTDGSGFFLIQRSGTTTQTGYQSTGAGVTQTISNSVSSVMEHSYGPWPLLALLNFGAGDSISNGWGGQLAAATSGVNLTPTEVANLCHRINVYLTAQNGTASKC